MQDESSKGWDVGMDREGDGRWGIGYHVKKVTVSMDEESMSMWG